jgi:pimeloyl-ACP methyl ester carboxylesterase
MHYAIEKLHFPLKNIIIFAWSIGGYSAIWAAVNYQDIQGLILDAIFDDVLPLAQRQMPLSISKLVEKSVRYYLDLNNLQLLKLYNGPFYLIRRTQDEVMNLIRDKFESNRANDILLSILPYRYPLIYNNNEILSLLKEYITSDKIQKNHLRDRYYSDRNHLKFQTDNYRIQNPISSYPCKFGLSNLHSLFYF